MSKLATIRKEYAVIDAIARWQETLWYPALFAVLCAISGSGNCSVYATVFWIYCVFTVFSALFADDLKVFIPPIFFFYCSLGSDLTPLELIYRKNTFDSFSTAGLVNFITAGVIMLLSFIIKLAISGTFSRFFKNRNGMFYSLVAICASLLLNGAFSSSASLKNLLYGVSLGGGLLLLYMLFSAMFDSSRDPAPYVCASILGVSLAAAAQLFVRAAQMHSEGHLFYTLGDVTHINRNVLQFSWGVATIVGAIIVLGIPAAFYLARKERFSLLYYISSIVLVLASIIIDTRSAIITSIIFFVFCSIFCCFSGKNKTANRIYTVASIIIGLGLLIAFHIYHGNLFALWNEILKFLRFDIISENSRLVYWKVGLSDFLRAPVFGIGFDAGVVIESAYQNFENAFTGLYHSVIIQFLAASGIVGFGAFGYHCVEYVRLMFKRRSGDKLLLLLLPLMIIAMSLVDNFFFQVSFQIFYAAFLALAQKESCEN